MSFSPIDPRTVHRWLHDGQEIAFIDVREAGLYGQGHPLLAANVPYSRLELEIVSLVPRPGTRTVLLADDDAGAQRAARALAALGYTSLHGLEGGAPAWRAAGLPLFQGVNVPSKAFAEVVEHVFHTPAIEPGELRRLQDAGADLVVLDSRTAAEYQRFHVPGAISCPGSELVLHLADLAPSPQTRVVVSCAGRTRGIMGAQTLIDAGVPHRVAALAGGTQGWRLAGLALEAGDGRPPPVPSAHARRQAAGLAAEAAARHAVPRIDHATWLRWRQDGARTTYLFDVRTPEEYQDGHVEGAAWAQGVQLIQCLDQFAATRGARLVLADDDGSRATFTAHWLQRLGWDAHVLAPGPHPQASGWPPRPAPRLAPVARVDAREAHALAAGGALLLDAGPSGDFRTAHAQGARWANRSAVQALLAPARQAGRVIVLAPDDALAHLLALEFRELAEVHVLQGGLASWRQAGLPVASSPGVPADAQRIDFLAWLHDRHEGNAQASAAYLQWEADLPAAIGDAREAGFRFGPAGQP